MSKAVASVFLTFSVIGSKVPSVLAATVKLSLELYTYTAEEKPLVAVLT